MNISTSTLRQDIYKILDEIIETKIPVKINRKGKKLQITLVSTENNENKKKKLQNLKKRKVLNCQADSLVHSDWYHEWKI